MWEGPAVVIGHEWDDGVQRNSYWIRSAGRCRLIPGQNLRYATLEEFLSQEQLLEELRASIIQLSEEKKPFEFDDHRPKRKAPTVGKSKQEIEEYPVTAISVKRDASVPPGQGISISEAAGRYFGSLPRVTTLSQDGNLVGPDNMLERHSQAPQPLV